MCLSSGLALPCHFWLGFVVRGFWVGFSGNLAIPGWGLGCVCLDTGFGRAPPFLAGVCGVYVCVGLGFACPPLFSSLGAGACGLLRAPRLFPAFFWWGCLWRGGVRELPWVVCAPPPSPFVFFRATGGCVVLGPVV